MVVGLTTGFSVGSGRGESFTQSLRPGRSERKNPALPLEQLVELVYEQAHMDSSAVLAWCREQLPTLIETGDPRLAAILEAVAQAKPVRGGAGELLTRTLLLPGAHCKARVTAAQRLLWVPPTEHLNELFDATLALAAELGEERRRMKVFPTLTFLAQPQHVDWLCVQIEQAARDIVWALAEGIEERYHSPIPALPLDRQEQLAKALLARLWRERDCSPGRASRPSVLAALTRAAGLLTTESTLEEVARVLAVGFLEPKELERGATPRTAFLLAERLQERGLLAVKRAFGDQELALCRLWYLSGRFKI